MKDQIQLQEIAGYLPYGVKMSRLNKDNKPVIIEMNNGNIMYPIEHPDRCKLILRPMSDLTKEITHNGKKIILAKALWSVSAEDEEDFDMYGHIPEYWSLCIHHVENNLSRTEYGDILAMYEYHFDIHNLIERGLAIKMNDLPPIKD